MGQRFLRKNGHKARHWTGYTNNLIAKMPTKTEGIAGFLKKHFRRPMLKRISIIKPTRNPIEQKTPLTKYCRKPSHRIAYNK
ncbi:MAG: hypothetical protein HS132_02470 [Planctomycetia bacterium]|nr:hypothetical protein [Planctomycetia bacterium]